MSETVWGQSGLKWDGFTSQAYVLDTEKIWKFELTDTSSGQKMTVGDLIEGFRGEKVEVDDRVIELALKSQSKEIIVKGPGFYQELVKVLYRFSHEGLSPFETLWFYYDSDSCMQDPQSLYSFFLVSRNKIVDESIKLWDVIGNGFDPSVLVPTSDATDPFWSNDAEWDEANARFWYRTFYSQTRTGQLMVLRPDEPDLYHYPEGRSKAGGGVEGWLSGIHTRLTAIRFALWVLIALAMIDLFLRWK